MAISLGLPVYLLMVYTTNTKIFTFGVETWFPSNVECHNGIGLHKKNVCVKQILINYCLYMFDILHLIPSLKYQKRYYTGGSLTNFFKIRFKSLLKAIYLDLFKGCCYKLKSSWQEESESLFRVIIPVSFHLQEVI